MMNSTTPRTLPKSEWSRRFAEKLRALRPALSTVEAVQRAIATYADAQDLSPEEAAQIYATELPPADPGTPGD
jgi:DNA-directed RNA polymerase specialized sigma24 family protein